MKVTSQISSESVKVFINSALHLSFERSHFRGLSSWKWSNEAGANGPFYIELLLAGTPPLTLSYDSEPLWLAVLGELARLR